MFEKEAEEYAEEHSFRVPYDGSNKFYDDVDFKASKEGFQFGAEFGYNKANKWHDLRKNPKDLPDTSGRYFVCTGGEPFIIDFDTETNAFGYWCMVLGEDLGVCDDVFETLEERDEDEVIAWCEVPKFEGGVK